MLHISLSPHSYQVRHRCSAFILQVRRLGRERRKEYLKVTLQAKSKGRIGAHCRIPLLMPSLLYKGADFSSLIWKGRLPSLMKGILSSKPRSRHHMWKRRDLAGSKQSTLDMVLWAMREGRFWQRDSTNNNEWLNLRKRTLPSTLKLNISSRPT